MMFLRLDPLDMVGDRTLLGAPLFWLTASHVAHHGTLTYSDFSL